ncbi:MAG: copper-binding protein [Actinobacteria bacterium]|nr:copper-binding protein [Actinomycetota bacterium]
MVNIDLKISGMTCQNCVRHVKEAISEVSGVKSVEVSLENASAKISSDFDLDRGALKSAVHEAGYAIVE